MATFDVFKSDAFNIIEMTNAIQDIKTVPTFLDDLGIFTPTPITTERFEIEMVGDGTLALIPTTERGAPRTPIGRDRRTMRDFSTVRLRQFDVLRASEIQGVRAFGSQTEVEAMQSVVAVRQAKLMRRLQLTKEYHRLGAINGIVLDSDGTSTIRNFYTEFGITPPTEIAFDWANKTNVTGFLRANVIRPMVQGLGGRWTPGARIVALCGDQFYDALIANSEVRASYLNWEAAKGLRGNSDGGIGRAYGNFTFGDIEWINYRGTDDNTTVAIGTTKCRLIPVGIPDIFQSVYSPGESFEVVNTLGQEFYSKQVVDPSGYNEFVEIDLASYRLDMCVAPQALLQGRAGS